MKKKIVFGIVALVALVAAWCVIFLQNKNVSLDVFPAKTFEVVPLNDQETGGYSTSEVARSDTNVVASVNIRSGRAFPYAGFAFNLRSVENRPVEFLDLSKFDSVEVAVASKRMKSVSLRLLTDDPVYTRKGNLQSFRVLVKNVASIPYLGSAGAKERYASTKFALSDFKVSEWWLTAQGLDEDDGLTYFHRAVMLEVVNGDGVLRGIPDEFEIRSIRLWGVDYHFVKVMVGILFVIFVMFTFFFYKLFRRYKLAK